jgi:cholesterol transport system auxiliary component
MSRPRLAVLAAAALLPLSLGACITLFPKVAPAPLYRFDATVAAQQAPAHAPYTVRLNTLDFDAAASGDQMMTTTGEQIAYIGTARWAEPATDLFAAAVQHGFLTAGGPAHIVSADAAGHADLRLQLHITRFEAVYEGGPTAAPTVHIHLRAEISREKDLVVVATQEFDATAAAGDNKLSAIVPAYDAATSKIVGDLAGWVNGAS